MALERSMPAVANRKFYGDPALPTGFRWDFTSSSDRFIMPMGSSTTALRPGSI